MSRSTHNRKRCGFGKKRQPQPAFRAAREHWRSVLELERGTPPIVPPAECQVALVYPNTYAVGMSSLGYQMVYRWINDQPGALAERFFCGENSTVSVENQRPIERFDLVAFSIAYELDYLGVVRFLLENSITPIAAQRDPSAQPIVVAGGICLLINRLPIHDLADVLVVGDGEQTVTRLVGEWVASGGQRLQFLKAIQSLEGVEVTEGACQRFGLESSPTPVRPHVAEALDAADAYSAITTPMTELGDRCLVEIARGCPYRCRFCFTGHTIAYRPRPFEAVREMIERGRRLTQRFGLIAPAVGSHPDIGRICEWCQSERLEVSFSSLRVEDVSPAMLDLIAAGGQQSATIAPEAGTERLRRYLGKKVTDDQVVAFAANAVARGLTDLRLYFMVGLPTEQAEDIEAIGRLVAATKRAAMAARPRAQAQIRIAVNAAIFVPKPGAPLAEQPRPPAAQVKKHLQRLSKSLGAIGGVELRAPSIAEAESQRVLSWGGREVFQALLKTAQTGGTWRHFLTEAAKSHDTEPRRHKDTKKVQR